MSAPGHPRFEVLVDVLIAGAGPAGLVIGLSLARVGVRVLVVEKRSRLSTVSRALVASTRTMEILRSWGLEDAVRAGSADAEPSGRLAPTLLSADGRRFPLGYPDARQAARVSPTGPVWVPQSHLEPILLARLRPHPTAAVRLNCELVDLLPERDRVRVVLRDAAHGRRWEATARYVVGADGAHSTVRERLGIGMDGPSVHGEYHGVQFRAPISGFLPGRPCGLNVITQRDAGGILAPRGPDDRWHYGQQRGPGRPGLADLPVERVTELIAAATGVADLRPRIERVSAFAFAARIADRYRRGRCLLIGDAAHQMTPRGGTGMNTAIHDAYDLGWRLAWVLRGWADPELLDGYEADRRPVGLHNVLRSADPDGARRTVEEALPWDLHGRVAHRWLPRGGRRLSTLDLLGDGLTALIRPGGSTGTGGPAEAEPPVAGLHAPVTTHVLDEDTADALGVPPVGSMLLTPGGRPAARVGNAPRH
ncbi:hypothetical protein GCM10022254_04060 [Actinomadura meridiana]|uniref:FAD-binding domain-containing protein n=1 Tax=Actinomadura meridiana TaxID=559626 RepID=A0ABP8BSZ5_9ACTN